METRRVYIPNKGAHNYAAAKEFGELIFCTDGYINRFAIGTAVRAIEFAMTDATMNDYLLITGLPVLNMLAAGIFVKKFSRLNLLLHDNNTGRYTVREVIL